MISRKPPCRPAETLFPGSSVYVGVALSVREIGDQTAATQPSTVVIDEFVYDVAQLPNAVLRLLREVEHLERDVRRHQRRARQLRGSYDQCQARLRLLLARCGVQPIRVVGY